MGYKKTAINWSNMNSVIWIRENEATLRTNLDFSTLILASISQLGHDQEMFLMQAVDANVSTMSC